MILLQKYHLLAKNDTYYVVSHESHPCPKCQSPLRVRDMKRRKAIEADGTVLTFCLRRLKCTECGLTHVELPDLLVPHKHYTRRAIELALNGSKSSCPAESSTIYRWNKGHAANLPDSQPTDI